MLVYIAVLIVFVCGIYFWLTKDHDYWKKRGVPFLKPRFLVGNMGEMLVMKRSFGQIVTELYSDFRNQPYTGIFNMRQPVLLVRDLNIIRDVLVKEFSKFHDVPFEINEEADPVLSKNPFFLKGDRWKIVRGQLTPLLTIAKMKAMFPLVQETCKTMVTYLSNEPNATGDKGLEAKELALKFTTDNVASCAFGLEGNSFKDTNAEFRTLAESFLRFTVTGMIRFFIATLFPGLVKYFKMSIGSKEISDKFKKIIRETVKYRQENQVVRNDFLDSIIELKSKPMPYEYTEDYMVAHAMTFFLDGSETSAVVFSFAMFELAANPDIQNRLKKEIDAVTTKYKGTITFEAIQEMSYLDAIFSETLRKYPPLMVMSRECTDDFTISCVDGSGTDLEVKMEKGVHVFIPVLALHRDPQYYPDPERFDPDRFTEDAKHPLPKNCFFGFGDGPRTCLGQRFANMQLKAGLIAIVSNFEIRLNSKTKVPLEFDPNSFILATKDGIWLNYFKRNKQE